MIDYIHFVVKDNAPLFEGDICEERKSAYRNAACLMAFAGCYDDASFLMDIIGEHDSTPWLKELA